MELETPPLDRVRPTRADQVAFARFQASALDRALADAKVWRNGYAMLGSGAGAILALIGSRLTDTTPAMWRVTLSATLGGGLLLVARALWMTLTIDGGRRTTSVSLGPIVQEHNSFEMFQVDQADAAINRLATSKWWALAGGLLCFAGLLCSIWLTSPASEPNPAPTLSAPAASASVASPSTSAIPTATP